MADKRKSMATERDSQYDTPLLSAANAVLVVHASARVNASASLVFRILRNTETWKDWNRFVPKVAIRSQPKEDDATDSEIAELIVNTSIAAAGGDEAFNEPGARVSTEALKLRRGSLASSVTSNTSTVSTKSGAQKYAEARLQVGASGAGRKSSIISSSSNVVEEPAAPVVENLVVPASQSRRGSQISTAEKRRMSQNINAIYGEPSYRLKVGTTLTLFQRMKLPTIQNDFKQLEVRVIEVSRPNDPTHPEETPALQRAATHTVARNEVYRLVWASDHGSNLIGFSALPGLVLKLCRVFEVRPITRGDGKEECEIRTWECQAGMKAKSGKEAQVKYLTQRFDESVKGLKEFCETMGGAVDRRDWMQWE